MAVRDILKETASGSVESAIHGIGLGVIADLGLIDSISDSVDVLSKKTTSLFKRVKVQETKTSKRVPTPDTSSTQMKKGISLPSFDTKVSRDESYHQQFSNLVNEVKNFEKLVDKNIDSLTEQAKDDPMLAKFINKFTEGAEDRSRVVEEFIKRGDVSSEDMKGLIESMESAVGAMEGLDANLEIGLGDMIDQYQAQIKDDRLSNDERREYLKELQKVLVDTTASMNIPLTREMFELTSMKADEVEFTKINTDKISRLIDKVESDALDVKMYTSISEMNNKFDKSILTQEELADVLNKKIDGDKSFRENLIENAALIAKGQEVKTGLVSAGMGAMGLGFLEDLGIDEKISDALSLDIFKKKMTGVNEALDDNEKGMRKYLKQQSKSGTMMGMLGKGTLVAVTAFAAFKIGGEINKGINKAMEWMTGTEGETLGGWMYDALHPEKGLEDKELYKGKTAIELAKDKGFEGGTVREAQDFLFAKHQEEILAKATATPVTTIPEATQFKEINKANLERKRLEKVKATPPKSLSTGSKITPAPVERKLVIDDMSVALANQMVWN